MIRKTLPWLLMLAFVLSGCLGPSDEGVETDGENGDGEGDGSDSGDGSNGDANETVEPLSATLDANVTEGNVPLTVSFDLDATGGNNESLSWSFLVGEDETESGDELPATIEYTFEEAGNHTVVLNITEGAETAEANVTIAVLAGESPEPVVIEGSAIIGLPLHSVLLCVRDDIDGNIHAIAPAEPGWVFTLESADAFTLYWFEGEDTFMSAGGTSGEVPAGATHAEICMVEGNALDDYVLTLWHPDHPDAP